MIRDDAWIKANGHTIFEPFSPRLVRSNVDSSYDDSYPILSYGTTSYGYDIRLSARDFRIFRRIPGQILDPKNFGPENLEETETVQSENGKYFILPGHSYGLGVSLEHITVPHDTIAVAIGKSTYARAGIIVNTTPAEPGWEGHLTLELSNASPADCRIYAEEGITQLLFFSGEPCQTSYSSRTGKYQHQPESVILPRV